MDLKKDLDKLRKVVINLQKSHIKLQIKIYGEESREIYEKDKWNLAENGMYDIDVCPRYSSDGDNRVIPIERFRTFIQKVKEDNKDLRKEVIKDKMSEDWLAGFDYAMYNNDLHSDKRAGKL